MAKSIYAIEMDFSKAKAQAGELEQVARDLEHLLNNDFHPCLSSITSGWKGSNADNFRSKGITIGEHIKQSANDLREAARTIRQIAKNTYDAEKQNYEIARMRTYKN